MPFGAHACGHHATTPDGGQERPCHGCHHARTRTQSVDRFAVPCMIAGMTLNEWIEQYGRGGIFEIARRAEIAINTVYNALHHKRITLDTAAKISAATGGEVTVADLIPSTTKANPWPAYEAAKKDIQRTAKTAKEYEQTLAELAERMGL